MTKISAKIIADSVDPRGNRLTTFVLTFPRMVLAELNTHRMFSRNSASSRAIPFKKMVQAVKDNPFIPVAWQKHHSGMQGGEYFTDSAFIEILNNQWIEGSKESILRAKILNESGATKQLCNRLLEPFMWHTVILTTSEEGLENFFKQRCPNYEQMTSYNLFNHRSRKDYLKQVGLPDTPERYKDWTDLDWLQLNKSGAEIHISLLAEAMWDAYNENKPKQLQPGEWHIPFEDEIFLVGDNFPYGAQDAAVKISTAKCARVSYTVVGEDKQYSNEDDIKLHDRLIEMYHMSPLEHVARCMTDEEYYIFIKGRFAINKPDDIGMFPKSAKGHCNNLKGFIPYRYIVENNY